MCDTQESGSNAQRLISRQQKRQEARDAKRQANAEKREERRDVEVTPTSKRPDDNSDPMEHLRNIMAKVCFCNSKNNTSRK